MGSYGKGRGWHLSMSVRGEAELRDRIHHPFADKMKGGKWHGAISSLLARHFLGSVDCDPLENRLVNSSI